MKRIILFICLISATFSFAQNDEAYVDELVTEFGDKLIERGIHQFYTATHYCSGTIEMFQINGRMCTSKGTYFEVYIIWEEEGVNYLKKIDNCGLFHSVELSTTQLTSFVFDNWDALKTNDVKTYKSEAYTGEPELRKEVQPCFRSFTFHSEGTSFQKSFNLFDVSNDSEGRNLNYETNSKLKLVELNSKIEEQLTQTIFKRQ